MADIDTRHDERLQIKERREIKTPSLYKVFLINDDYTTMDFVVYVLENIFRKPPVEATQVMLHVHKNGRGLAGVYSLEIAETKISSVHELSQINGHPLKCTMEEE